jgi:hypothetical protein
MQKLEGLYKPFYDAQKKLRLKDVKEGLLATQSFRN